MNKYPFVVTVYRKPGSTRPIVQQHSFEDVGVAHSEMGKFGNDQQVVRIALSVTLKEVTYHSRLPRGVVAGG
jgi:hypothetical protein